MTMMYHLGGRLDNMVSLNLFNFVQHNSRLLMFNADVEVVGNVRCDMTPVARAELYSRKNYDTGESYVLAYLTCKMRTTFTTLEVETFVNETSIGRTTIAIGEEELRESRWQGQGPQAGSISSLDS